MTPGEPLDYGSRLAVVGQRLHSPQQTQHRNADTLVAGGYSPVADLLGRDCTGNPRQHDGAADTVCVHISLAETPPGQKVSANDRYLDTAGGVASGIVVARPVGVPLQRREPVTTRVTLEFGEDQPAKGSAEGRE